IAEQCPQSGGMAVYVARSLVALFNDTIVYDDDNVCLQQGYFRRAHKANKKSIPYDITIVPNPADESTQIILNKKQEGVCKVNITDAYSKCVYNNEFDCKTQQLTVSTKWLVQGIYFVEIKISGSTVKTAKLIITR
ncbi:MAG TPA: T9SS type A sorting domain-containing protein, partial [Bacteroidia bacterium]|nr:T9SS type A sorting domain-containing protein [Bacteroidia bacterium]